MSDVLKAVEEFLKGEDAVSDDNLDDAVRLIQRIMQERFSAPLDVFVASSLACQNNLIQTKSAVAIGSDIETESGYAETVEFLTNNLTRSTKLSEQLSETLQHVIYARPVVVQKQNNMASDEVKIHTLIGSFRFDEAEEAIMEFCSTNREMFPRIPSANIDLTAKLDSFWEKMPPGRINTHTATLRRMIDDLATKVGIMVSPKHSFFSKEVGAAYAEQRRLSEFMGKKILTPQIRILNMMSDLDRKIRRGKPS